MTSTAPDNSRVQERSSGLPSDPLVTTSGSVACPTSGPPPVNLATRPPSLHSSSTNIASSAIPPLVFNPDLRPVNPSAAGQPSGEHKILNVESTNSLQVVQQAYPVFSLADYIPIHDPGTGARFCSLFFQFPKSCR